MDRFPEAAYAKASETVTTPERSKRLGDLFSQACDLGESELATFLDRECRDEPGLREELEGLLSFRRKTTKPLGSSELGEDSLAGFPTPIARAIAECAERPTRIRQYTVLDLLGEGGMGSVYLAEQAEPVRRRVALKVIKAGMYSKEVVARLEAERQALAIMNHPSIACFYDAGTTEDGHPYFAMEYVKGLPITDYCDRHRLGLEKRLELFMQVCQAVEHAHQRGVIHRDIKPGNVLVCSIGEGPVAKIIDFGVAKAPSRKLTEKTLHTQPGRAVGTPAYMSPEQADMSREEVDHRSDIYALGVLLYELLVGQLPLELEDESLSFSEVVRRIREVEPAAPSRRWTKILEARAQKLAEERKSTTTSLRNALRGGLDWITMKALEKEPARRYASAADLAEDIRRHISHEPVLAGPPGTGYRLRKLARKHRGALTAVACVVVAFAVGQVANLIEFGTATRNYNLADARFEATRAELARFQAYFADMQAASSSLDRGNVIEARRLLDACPEELHVTWEWRHLRLRSDLSWRVLEGHEAMENPQPSRKKVVATFTPDGKQVVSGGWDRTIRIWSVDTKEPPTTIVGHDAGVNAVAVTSDGSLIASGSSDRTVRLWDAKTGLGRGLLGSHDGQVSCVAFSMDDELVASGSWDTSVRLWRVPGEESTELAPPVVLKGHEGNVNSVAFSPDRESLASGGDDQTIRLWNLKTLVAREFQGHAGTIWSLAFDPTGARLVSGSSDRTLRLWDVANGEVIETARAREVIVAVAFSRDGTRIASGSPENTIHLWDARMWTGKPISTLRGHHHQVWSVAFSPDGGLIASGSRDRTVRLWDSETRGGVTALDGHQGRVWSVTVSRDGQLIASGSADKNVRIWNATTGDEVEVLEGHEGEVRSVSISRDGRKIASASADGTVRLWDTAKKELLVSPLQHDGAVRAVAFSPDGKRLASGSVDLYVYLWDVETGDLQRKLPGHRGVPSALAYSPDGNWLASAAAGWADADLVIRIWDTQTGEIVEALGGHTDDVNCVVFSPDGKSLASGSHDRTVRLWDIARRESVPLEGHEAPVVAVAFSPDGARLVSASEDNTLRVWDVATRNAVAIMSVDATVLSVVFGPRGQRLVTGSADNRVRVWESEFSSAREMWRAAGKRER